MSRIFIHSSVAHAAPMASSAGNNYNMPQMRSRHFLRVDNVYLASR